MMWGAAKRNVVSYDGDDQWLTTANGAKLELTSRKWEYTFSPLTVGSPIVPFRSFSAWGMGSYSEQKDKLAKLEDWYLE